MSTGTQQPWDRFLRFVRGEMDRQMVLNVISPVLFIAFWEIASQTGIVPSQFFPPPSSIVGTGYEMTVDGSLFHHTFVSLSRILPAFVIGGGLGVVFGLLMGWSKRIHAVVDPLVSVLFPLPKVVLLPIIFLIFGISETSRIVALMSAIFPLVLINTVGGAKSIDPEYIEAAKDNGASGYAMLREVYLPGALPHIFSGLSLGMGVGFILIVVVEMVAAESGLGFLIWNSWEFFTINQMYVAILAINILGIIFTYGLEWIGKWLTRWQTT